MSKAYAKGLDVSRSTIMISLGALCGLVLSKGLAAVPGYAIDDYALVQAQTPDKFGGTFFLGQARPVAFFLAKLAARIDVSLVSSYWPMLLLTITSFSLAIALGLKYVVGPYRSALPLLVSAAFIIGTHPYFTELYTFRQTLIFLAPSGVLLTVALTVLKTFDDSPLLLNRRRRIFVLTSMFVLLGFSGQLPLLLLSLFILGRFINDCLPKPSKFDVGYALRKNHEALASLILATIIYVAGHLALVGTFFSTNVSDGRVKILDSSATSQRLQELKGLFFGLVVEGSPIVPRSLTLILTATVALILALALFSARRAFVQLFCALTVLIGVGFLPIALTSIWAPNPRAIIGVSFGIGIFFALASRWIVGVGTVVASTLLVSLGLGYAMLGSSIFIDQQRLNRWDMFLAQQVALDLVQAGADPSVEIVVVNPFPKHMELLSHRQGELNLSAFVVGWALEALVTEATGQRWNFKVEWGLEVCQKPGALGREFEVREVSGAYLVCFFT